MISSIPQSYASHTTKLMNIVLAMCLRLALGALSMLPYFLSGRLVVGSVAAVGMAFLFWATSYVTGLAAVNSEPDKLFINQPITKFMGSAIGALYTFVFFVFALVIALSNNDFDFSQLTLRNILTH